MARAAERIARAENVLDSVLRRADRAMRLNGAGGRGQLRGLILALEDAQKDLERRLRAAARATGGGRLRFTEASAIVYRRQANLAIQYLRARMRGVHDSAVRQQIRQGWTNTRTVLSGLEESFTGISRALRIDEAAVFEGARDRISRSLLEEHATSMDRYGARLVRDMERTMSRGMLTGASQSEMIDALVGQGGPTGMVSMRAVQTPSGVRRITLEAIPEGLFVRYRYWATRIIRTETARAQNLAADEAMRESRRHDFPDLKRKILAMMDDRTAPDSLAVHGQIRELDEPFVDGSGRVYMLPPARPNDREMVVPWRERWSETSTSRPRSPTEAARAMKKASATKKAGFRNMKELRAFVRSLRGE